LNTNPVSLADNSALDKTYNDSLNTMNKIWKGNNAEPFDTQFYVPSAVIDAAYANGNSDTGLLNAIQKHQIVPMENISSAYSDQVAQINTNYVDLCNNIAAVTNTYGTGVRDQLMANNIYDFSGNLANFNNPVPSLTDAMISDTNILIAQENTVLVLGTIAAATLLIAGIYMARE
jgi:hypothetical protein